MLTKEVKEMFLIGDKGHGDDSNTFDETMSDIDFEKWLNTMKSEIDSMHSNQVRILVGPPEGVYPLDVNGSTKER